MSIKLTFLRRLLVNGLYFLGFGVMFGIPAFFGIREIYNNIQFVEGNILALNWAVSGVFIMIIFAVLYIKYMRKWIHRKLIGLQVRDELGIMPIKGVAGIISDRFLRTLEYVYPFTITLLILYVSKYMFGQYDVFEKLYHMNTVLLYLSIAGFGLFLIADFVKISLMKKQEVETKLGMNAKKDKLELKRLSKQNKQQLKALELEKQLNDLKTTLTAVPEVEEEIVD